MKKTVLITGANGMLAQHLGKLLAQHYELRFLTRRVKQPNDYLWDINEGYIDPKALKNLHAIIHLAGSSIANKRWTKKAKESIVSSRVASANLILAELKKHKQSIDTFISASATGYYGAMTTDAILTEDSPNGTDFLSDVCRQWEAAAHAFKTNQVATQVSIVRLGVILAKNEGILSKLVPPVRYGLGAVIGSGKQYLPWIHIEDLSQIFMFLLSNSTHHGTYNAVSPTYTTNKTLVTTIANKLNRKVLLPNIPKFVLRWVFGEAAVLLTEGNRVSAEKLQAQGFRFKYNVLDEALEDVL